MPSGPRCDHRHLRTNWNFNWLKVIKTQKQLVFEGSDQRVAEFSNLPSPYLAGTLDQFFPADLDNLFETNRGYPYSCTFCNDGHQMRNKAFWKPHDLIQSELEHTRERVIPTADSHLADNDPCYLSGELAEYLRNNNMMHTRGRPYHPQTQGKIERWH